MAASPDVPISFYASIDLCNLYWLQYPFMLVNFFVRRGVIILPDGVVYRDEETLQASMLAANFARSFQVQYEDLHTGLLDATED